MKTIHNNTPIGRELNLARTLLVVLLAICAQFAMAQSGKLVISGTVSDELGPLMGAHVIEVDADNRNINATTTDIDGNFSMSVKSQKNKLRISYVGCQTQVLAINKRVFKITLSSAMQMKEVVKTAKKRIESSGLAIPEREVSFASQSIDAKEFEGLGISTVDEALQGRIAGLDIVMASGNLGAGTSMRLRGTSSINANTEPLVVVDGNVFESDYNRDFDFQNATEEKFAELLNVNPEDIEKITVLKDAAGTAIWGSQGANGVIEIKTKRGKRGPTRVTYSYRLNCTYQPEGMKMLDGGGYTMYLKEAYYNPRQSNDAANIPEINYLHSDAEFPDWRNYNNSTDWVDAVKQTGFEQKHYVSLQGGGEKASFRVSGGYDHSTGSVIAQKLDRFTTRTALDYYVSDRIKVTTNFNFTYTNNHKNYLDLLNIAYRKMPNMAIYEEIEDGVPSNEYYHMPSTASSVFDSNSDINRVDNQKGYVNPIALAHRAKNDERTYNIQPEFIINYNLLGTDDSQHQLKYDGKVNFSIFNKYNETFFPSDLVSGNIKDEMKNRSVSDASKSFAITTTHTLTFMPHFNNEDHSLMAMVRFQLTNGTSKSQSMGVYGLPFGNIQNAASDGIVSAFGTGAGQWRSMYMTASLHYAFKGRYVFDFSLRRDGSTKFGADSRWGNFPGVSLRWNIVDEPWMKWSEKWLSMLSFRPGWGRVGNQPVGEGLYYAKYSNAAAYIGNSAIYPSNIQLANLRWEEKESWNIGVDLGLFNNKVTADFNYYWQHTSSLLMQNYRLPSSSGFDQLSWVNEGDMQNNGWELNLNTNSLIKIGNVTVDLNATFANNRNEITDMNPTVIETLNNNNRFTNRNGQYAAMIKIGAPLGAIYGFRSKGVYQYSNYSEVEVPGVSGPNAPVVRNAEGEVVLDEYGNTKPMMFCYGDKETTYYEFKGGDAIYEDVNHDGNIDRYDIVYLGSSLPKITGGFGLKIKWKQLSLNAQFNYRYGNKVINMARATAEAMNTNDNQSAAVNWRWRVEGDVTDIPRAMYKSIPSYNWLGSDRFVEDGSFLRLNYLQLSYALPQSVLKRIHMNGLSVYVSGNNICKFTKYSGADPEVNYGSLGIVTDNAKTPRARSFTVGATIQF